MSARFILLVNPRRNPLSLHRHRCVLIRHLLGDIYLVLPLMTMELPNKQPGTYTYINGYIDTCSILQKPHGTRFPPAVLLVFDDNHERGTTLAFTRISNSRTLTIPLRINQITQFLSKIISAFFGCCGAHCLHRSTSATTNKPISQLD